MNTMTFKGYTARVEYGVIDRHIGATSSEGAENVEIVDYH